MGNVDGNIMTLQTVYLSLLTITVILTNTTVVLTLVLRRHIISVSTKYFLYVMNLAICDLIVGVFLVPVYISILLGESLI